MPQSIAQVNRQLGKHLKKSLAAIKAFQILCASSGCLGLGGSCPRMFDGDDGLVFFASIYFRNLQIRPYRMQ